MNIILDTETTGLDAPMRAVEIAWIVFDDDMKVLDEQVHLVNPGRPIDPGASNIHGIYAKDVENAETAAAVMARVPKGDPKLTVVGHNVSFDIRVVGEFLEYHADVCTLALSRRWVKGTTNHKLPTLQKELGLTSQVSHSALGDCHTSLELLRHCAGLAGRNFQALVELESVPKMLLKMPFGMHKGKLFTEVPRGYLEWLAGREQLHKDLVYTLKKVMV
jgi:exodeoxyribonuclease X